MVTALLPAPVLGLAKLRRFRMLKNSARNCTIPCSPRAGALVSLLIAKSTFFRSGPRRKFRGAFPRVPARGRSNIVGSNHLLGLCVITLWRSNEGSRSGRSGAGPAGPGLFGKGRVAMSGVGGRALCLEKMVADHQPLQSV